MGSMAQDLAQSATTPQTGSPRVALSLFVLCLLIPANFNLGGLNLSTTRFFVVLALIPLLMQWMSARAGRIGLVDILIVLHSIWIVLALVVNHGMPRFAYGGMP